MSSDSCYENLPPAMFSTCLSESGFTSVPHASGFLSGFLAGGVIAEPLACFACLRYFGMSSFQGSNPYNSNIQPAGLSKCKQERINSGAFFSSHWGQALSGFG